MAPPSIVVVGAGPAGIRAAERLTAAGMRPVVIDEAVRTGGQIYRRQPANFKRPPEELYGFEAARAKALHTTFDALANRIDYRPETLVWNVYEGRLHTLHAGRTDTIAFDALILTTGATDRLLPVPGWTLPGVYTLGGAQIALKAQACTIGERPVFLGTGPLLYLVAYQYLKAGVRPAAVLDTSRTVRRIEALPLLASRPAMLAKGLYYSAVLKARGVRMEAGIVPAAVTGKDRVEAVHVRDGRGRQLSVDCDGVGLGFGLRPETQLADLARCEFAFDPAARLWLPRLDAMGRTSISGLYAAGDGTGILGADAAEISGRLAACAALIDLGVDVPAAETSDLQRRLEPMHRFKRGLEAAFPWPADIAAAVADDTLVCRCEAISAGELRRAAHALDAKEINRAKAFSRVGMGRCQGRYCGPAATEILAAARGVTLEQIGRLRGQAPVKPLPVSVESAS